MFGLISKTKYDLITKQNVEFASKILKLEKENFQLKNEIKLNKEMVYKNNKTISLKPIHEFKLSKDILNKTKIDLNCSDKELNLIIIDLYDFMYTVQKYKDIPLLNEQTFLLWNNFVLDTNLYLDFCNDCVGFFVHLNYYNQNKNYFDKDQILNKYKNTISSNKLYESYRNRQVENNSNDNDSDYLLSYLLYTNLMNDNSINSINSINSNNIIEKQIILETKEDSMFNDYKEQEEIKPTYTESYTKNDSYSNKEVFSNIDDNDKDNDDSND